MLKKSEPLCICLSAYQRVYAVHIMNMIESDLANFIGEMVAKYAEAIDLDNLPDSDHYLLMKRIKQLYVEFYKSKNIAKFRNEKSSIERKAAT